MSHSMPRLIQADKNMFFMFFLQQNPFGLFANPEINPLNDASKTRHES